MAQAKNRAFLATHATGPAIKYWLVNHFWSNCAPPKRWIDAQGNRVTNTNVCRMTKGSRREARLNQPPSAVIARTSVTKLARLPVARVACQRNISSLLACFAKGCQLPQTYN